VHAAARPPRLVALDDEVTVVLLDREVDDRNRSTDARAMARRSAAKTRGERSEAVPPSRGW